ncbi:hypothetical protein ACFE04_011368 [Oxalis oulophora]
MLLSHYPLFYVPSLSYFYLKVHKEHRDRLKTEIRFSVIRKRWCNNKVRSSSESVCWLNHVMEKIWPVVNEVIVSQSKNILLSIIPSFLEKILSREPQIGTEVMIRHLYMGRDPPHLTDIRVLHDSPGDDDLVLEMGMNFLAADDMSSIIDVKLLGGMWANMHITGMHIEGKVKVGIKFLPNRSFLGRVSFIEPPHFMPNIKVFSVIPMNSGWLNKRMNEAFAQMLVEPNILVCDMEKFVSPEQGNWFRFEKREAIAFAKVEVIEASGLKPSYWSGLADPYVKGHLGDNSFKTEIQWKTLAPKWHQNFNIPITTWESPNLLVIEVLDKDRCFDDALGDCTVLLNNLRSGQRHDMWLPLENITMGNLHLAITVLEDQLDLVGEEGSSSADGSSPDSQSSRGHMKDMAKAIAKKAKKGAHDLKHVLFPKDSSRRQAARDISVDSETSHESSLLTP